MDKWAEQEGWEQQKKPAFSKEEKISVAGISWWKVLEVSRRTNLHMIRGSWRQQNSLKECIVSTEKGATVQEDRINQYRLSPNRFADNSLSFLIHVALCSSFIRYIWILHKCIICIMDQINFFFRRKQAVLYYCQKRIMLEDIQS